MVCILVKQAKCLTIKSNCTEWDKPDCDWANGKESDTQLKAKSNSGQVICVEIQRKVQFIGKYSGIDADAQPGIDTDIAL